MKRHTAAVLLIPFILSACSANLSDKERVDAFYEKRQSSLESDIDKTVSDYASGIVTKYHTEPYFNPTQKIPHYYAEQLDSLSIPYPADLVYVNDEYNFYKDRAQFNQKNYQNIEIESDHNH